MFKKQNTSPFRRDTLRMAKEILCERYTQTQGKDPPLGDALTLEIANIDRELLDLWEPTDRDPQPA